MFFNEVMKVEPVAEQDRQVMPAAIDLRTYLISPKTFCGGHEALDVPADSY